MDLLAGYGSGADSEGPSENSSGVPEASALPSAPAAAAPMPDANPAELLSRLPAPSSSRVPLFSGLPKPKAVTKKVVVQFRVPITYGDAPASADEEAPVKKKQKTSARGLSLAEFLPPPKNTSGGIRLDTGARPSSAAAAKPAARRRYDSDDDELVPGTEDRTGMELGPGDPNEPEDNEAYRVDQSTAGAAAEPAYDYHHQQQQQQYGYQQQQGHDYYASYAHQQQYKSAVPAAVDPGEALLAAALEAERQKALRRGGGDPLAAAAVQFKEVNADAIRYMDPTERAAMSGVRMALGADYEARLRTEAGPAPNRLAKRKHQIGSLFAQAKAQELEDFERRAAGMKTKAETQSKYGW